MKLLDRCLLHLSRPAVAIGLFEPGEPWRFFTDLPPAGAARLALYGVCSACARNPKRTARRVEQALEREPVAGPADLVIVEGEST